MNEGRDREAAHLLARFWDAPLLAVAASAVDVPFVVATEQRAASLPEGLAGAWQGEGSRGAGYCILPERAPDSISAADAGVPSLFRSPLRTPTHCPAQEQHRRASWKFRCSNPKIC